MINTSDITRTWSTPTAGSTPPTQSPAHSGKRPGLRWLTLAWTKPTIPWSGDITSITSGSHSASSSRWHCKKFRDCKTWMCNSVCDWPFPWSLLNKQRKWKLKYTKCFFSVISYILFTTSWLFWNILFQWQQSSNANKLLLQYVCCPSDLFTTLQFNKSKAQG